MKKVKTFFLDLWVNSWVVSGILAIMFGFITIFDGFSAIMNKFGNTFDVYNGNIIDYNSGKQFLLTFGIFLFSALLCFFSYKVQK